MKLIVLGHGSPGRSEQDSMAIVVRHGAQTEAVLSACMIRNLAKEILECIERVATNRTLLITEQGYLGIGPKETKIGDTIAAMVGGDVLYVLRENAHGEEIKRQFQLVGEAYIHGLMDGEVWSEMVHPLEDISLI